VTLTLALALVLAPGLAGPDSARAAGANNSKKDRDPARELFASTNVRHIRIDIPKESLPTLRRYEFSWDGGAANQERPAVLATVHEDGGVYTNVAVHLKGAAGSFRPIDANNPALTLNFDKHAKGQSFHGLRKLSLNNSVQDPTFVNEQIGREIFIAAGVPVPRSTHATVELNGRRLGVYVLVEGVNKAFLRRHFEDDEGNLYDGGFLQDIDQPKALNSGADPKDQGPLEALVLAASEPDRTNRWTRLGQVLDAARFIDLIAIEVMLCHWDGYALNKNNYRVYHDPASRRAVFLPHGLDQLFGVVRSSPTETILPRLEGMIARAIMETPEGRRRYFQRVSHLATNLFHAAAITNRIHELAAKIQPVLAASQPASAKRHQRDIADLCQRVGQRVQSIHEQLSATSRALNFDPDGIARLGGWTSRDLHGQAAFAQPTIDLAGPAYEIRAAQSAVGSWRTKVVLESGRYRLEAKVRIRGVVPDPGDRRGGAGLRVGGRRLENAVKGDSDWKFLGYEFEVEEAVSELELVCELRAARGRAWFDSSSLRLVRL
jgi:hypothetical protein